MHGFYLIDKPVGPSSHSAVQRVRKVLGFRGRRGTKAGHGGTLDPFASGLLLVLIGKATKLMPFVVGHDKRYLVGIRFGASSTTDDIEGELTASDAPAPTLAAVTRALEELAASTEQVPPAVSALHIDGKRAYARVRNGETVVIPPRPVRITSIEIVEWQPEVAAAGGSPRVVLDVRCGTGTYMRALARDLGEAVGCPALCDELRRTEIGEWSTEESIVPDDVTLDVMRDAIELLGDMPRMQLGPVDLESIVQGRRILATDATLAAVAISTGSDVALVTEDGTLAALGELLPDGMLQPRTVLVDPAPVDAVQGSEA
ncbi:MAG: truB [Thermoleophilia bacterium]|nr:truB [Thermoleophilia bacterium]